MDLRQLTLIYSLKLKFILQTPRLTVGSLFYDAFRVTWLYSLYHWRHGYKWMTMNGKGCGRKCSWPNLKYYAGIRLEGLRKTTKNLNQDSLSPRPRFEPGSSRIRSRSANHSTTTFGALSYDEAVRHSKVQRHVWRQERTRSTLGPRRTAQSMSRLLAQSDAERRCRVVSTPTSCSEGTGFIFRLYDVYPHRPFRDFTQPLHANITITHEFTLGAPPSTFVETHRSLIILSFEAIQSELWQRR
jgi:hypothetical protein